MKKITSKLAQLLVVVAMTLGVIAVLPSQGVSAAADSIDCTDTSDAKSLTISGGAKCSKSADQQQDLFGSTGVFTTITNILLFLIGAISVIMLIYGGIRYTVSGGDSGQVTTAKNTIMYAVIGIIVALLAFAIVNFVIGSLGSE